MRSSNRKSRQQCPCPGSCNTILVSGARNDCWHSRSFDQSAHSFWMPGLCEQSCESPPMPGGGGPQSSYRAATRSPTSDEGDPELRLLNMEQTTLTALVALQENATSSQSEEVAFSCDAMCSQCVSEEAIDRLKASSRNDMPTVCA